MKIAVLGSSGYIAQRTIHKLAQAEHDVIAFSTTGRRHSPEFRTEMYSLISLREKLVSLGPDVVVNMANHFTRFDTTPDVLAMVDVNCALITEIACACLELDATVLHVGTAWEVDYTHLAKESPDAYSLFRSMATLILDWHEKVRNLKVYQLKLYDTYGPGDPRKKVVQLLIKQISAAESLDMTLGDQILELVHVDDVAGAILQTIEHLGQLQQCDWDSSTRNVYWCRPNQPITLRELATTLEELSGKALNINWGARAYRPGEQFARTADPRPQVPEWSPSVNLRDGLRQILKSSGHESE